MPITNTPSGRAAATVPGKNTMWSTIAYIHFFGPENFSETGPNFSSLTCMPSKVWDEQRTRRSGQRHRYAKVHAPRNPIFNVKWKFKSLEVNQNTNGLKYFTKSIYIKFSEIRSVVPELSRSGGERKRMTNGRKDRFQQTFRRKAKAANSIEFFPRSVRILRVKSHHFPKHHWLVGICNQNSVDCGIWTEFSSSYLFEGPSCF